MRWKPDLEREFLIRLAPVWLACRYRIMGGKLIGKWPSYDLAFDLLGMVDYGWEMRLICAEVLTPRAKMNPIQGVPINP